MAGYPWEFTVIPDTIDTVYIKYAGTDDSTAVTVTKSAGKGEGDGFFYTSSFVEANAVEVWADGYQRTTAIVGDSVVDFTVQPQTTAQRMGAYIGSQKGSWRIGNQRVMPAIPKENNITLTFIKEGTGAYRYPENITLNGVAISEDEIVSVPSGTSCTITVTYSDSNYELYIYLDGVLVQSGSSSITYTFAPTENHTIGASRSISKT